jgi:hypothetical protein
MQRDEQESWNAVCWLQGLGRAVNATSYPREGGVRALV